MKKVLSTITVLAMMVATLSLFACGGNDDDGDNGGIIAPPPSTTKHLIKVTHNNTGEYFYDNQGRITLVKTRYENESETQVAATYSYDNNTIIETVDLRGLGGYQNTYTIENGRIIKVSNSSGNTTHYSYKDGYIITETEKSGRENHYEWSDGNLMTILRESRAVYTYDYTNYTAPQGFFPLHTEDADICKRWGMSDYLGKTMNNLPSKRTELGLYVTTYEWTIKDGLPIKMIETNPGLSSNDKPTYETYIFEWE